ncbi:hypothetical protein K502DRAFT_347444 [Neoconidiobolus thromboides FSU 785]|nr:hypothetical protein K502DRAFT_347444 [Neoconidiobolus thromboides FSU 785]
MLLKFEQLCSILLDNAFRPLDPEEFFDLYLSKRLFNNISNIIKCNPVYSTYDQYEVKKYWSYQENFIKKNGPLMIYDSDTSNNDNDM